MSRRPTRLARALLIAITALSTVPAAAAADEGSFSYTQSIPVAPASNYAGSGGGDGWALAMTHTAVYNVFHHQATLQVACHLQVDASPCWDPKTIRDDGGNDFRVSGQPALDLDQGTGHLHVFATRPSDQTAGVVCIDTKRPASDANPFCGYTALTPAGDAPSSSAVSNGIRVRNRFLAFNYVDGEGHTGARNGLLCFDVTDERPCNSLPYFVNLGTGAVGVASGPTFRVPSLAAIGTRVLVPAVVDGADRVGCFDIATLANCGGSFPLAAPGGYVLDHGSAFPSLSADGDVTGFCLPTDTIPCYGLDGATATTPSGLPAAITPDTPWNGPAFVRGPRVYRANGNGDKVECFSFNTGAGCDGFPKSTPGAGYIYTVNPDPERPECIWVNADYGTAQLQNFDAFDGGPCGKGPVRVLASSIVVPTQQCQPTGYTSLRILKPPRNAYDTGTITFLDGDGRRIPGVADRAIGADGLVDLRGLDLATTSGLPQFLVTLDGASDTPTRVDVELSWRGELSEACVKPETNTREYVALGESFASGFGLAPYFPGTHKDAGPNDCQRSTRASATVVRDAFDLNLNFHACQGGVTDEFYTPRNSGTWGEKPQLDYLSASTGLVTFSIGGNDAHFSEIVMECALGFELLPFNSCHGEDKVEKPIKEAFDRLAGRTAGPAEIHPYDDIFKDVRRRAPFSDRVVIGYPDFFLEDGKTRRFFPDVRCKGIKRSDQRWMVEKIHELNDIIKTSAARNGFRYADPKEFREGEHQFCADGEDWFGGITDDNKFHPSVNGAHALGDAVVAALNTPDAEGKTFTVGPAETKITSTQVAPGQFVLSIVTQWPGSDVEVTLVSPSGQRYTRSAPGAGVKHSNGPTWEQYEVPTPEPGTWQVELYGKDVDPDGEPVRVLATTEPFPNQTPTARISYAEAPDGTLTFSSAQSTDPDGTLTRREWYVATGTAGADTHSEGDTVSVPAARKGSNVQLVVTDDRGATSFAEAIFVPDPVPGPGGTDVPVTGPDGKGIPPVLDQTAPRLSGLRLERAVRRGGKLRWVRTRRLSGKVRLRVRTSEAATLQVQLAARAKPKRVRRVTVRAARAGTVTIALQGAARKLVAGKVRLRVTATDAAGNVGAGRLSARR